ncbi:hypothetical protein O9X90_25715 [Agrobacterium leguminum]|uniref:hypothetical protein n=1 Tax=Agrobacterium leguminum TaxID=2792015 RepID=UPI0022B82F66|nr:hypothetical protein [Agrobacterium leguminum]MCZ7935729.1 hypothetical protein [Agrobacterium leguminum]
MAEHIHGSTEALRLYLAELKTKADALDRECTRLRAIVSEEIEIVEGLLQKLQPENAKVCAWMDWRKISVLVVAAAAVLFAPATAAAACTVPAANAGEVIFNDTYKVMQYCNGSQWINTGAAIANAPQTGCTNPTGIVGDAGGTNQMMTWPRFQ